MADIAVCSVAALDGARLGRVAADGVVMEAA